MDTIQTALKLIRPGCYMASIDLKDAYYSVPVADEDRKLLKFQWGDRYFQFTCLPTGLACAPRLFTKLLKPVYTHIRSMGHTCMSHIDDSLFVGYEFTMSYELARKTFLTRWTLSVVWALLYTQVNQFFSVCNRYVVI